ncbi:hypothetical protein V5O48_013781 [Marasmius crinis-equi]|uniref:Uncharacterized protein n=1 Tax=Marasmius crinis-equi TaxID=585013 RepID=A0ABR3EZ55_9AGAR
MTTFGSAWRVRFYERTGTSGGTNVDVRGDSLTSSGCIDIPAPGDRSMRFDAVVPPPSPPTPTDRVTVWTAAGCTGTGAAYVGPDTENDFTAAPPFGISARVLSFNVN